MADARLRSEWLTKINFMELSDAAWRVFTGALMWAVGNGTDGEIPKRYLRWVHPSGEIQPQAVDEITRAGLWTETPATYQFVGWDTTLGQSTAQQIEKYREDARIRQQRRRQRKKTADAEREDTPTDPTSQTQDITANVTRDVTANVGTARHGTATAIGKDPQGNESDSAEFEKYTDEHGLVRNRRIA